ncbi:hypothetical protein SAMN04488025_1353 [Planifilum fulgidum]|jgi:hypothetical protein|uniref:Uncharacterized protein n=1 Tax=Planifilum fulgidum TaxID=201973 RepID=A0A1I2RW23_9BACL|nr:hypothetical protein [Planifilum fulgidum]SFG44690.1 hypothetical protein SAMN04488025_1353 [Planifilum fulgidum]
MFQVQTYIYFPVIRIKNPSFPAEIPINDTDTLRKAEPYLDFKRLQGHIELSYYGQPILTEKFGDFIIEYWSYLLNAIEDLMNEGCGGMFLPDQPIPIDFEEKGPNWVLMTVGEGGEYGKWLLPREELIKTLINGAVQFFKELCDAFSDAIVQQRNLKALYEETLDFKKQYIGE